MARTMQMGIAVSDQPTTALLHAPDPDLPTTLSVVADMLEERGDGRCEGLRTLAVVPRSLWNDPSGRVVAPGWAVLPDETPGIITTWRLEASALRELRRRALAILGVEWEAEDGEAPLPSEQRDYRDYWKLDGEVPVHVRYRGGNDDDHWARQWAADTDGMARRVIAKTYAEAFTVSTVFLTVDHAFGGGPPILFESMIFGGGATDDDCERATTCRGAERLHRRMVRVALGAEVLE